MLESRPLVQANLLGKFSVAVEQTLIVFSCTPRRALWVDLWVVADQNPSQHLLAD
jgi:hypothetical protein